MIQRYSETGDYFRKPGKGRNHLTLTAQNR